MDLGTGASEQLNSSSLKVPPVRAVGRARLSSWLAKEQEDSTCVTGNGVRLVAVHKPTRRQVTGKGNLLYFGCWRGRADCSPKPNFPAG